MYRNAPARSQNVKCRFIVTFVCTEEFLLGFFLSSRIITLSKILPLGPNFNLTCILYYILWRIHISDLSLNVCNCCRVKERKVNDDKRLEGQNGVTLYALGHFMARHKKIWMECTYHNIQYQTVILMIWSENKVISVGVGSRNSTGVSFSIVIYLYQMSLEQNLFLKQYRYTRTSYD